jgi:hypothetical protein
MPKITKADMINALNEHFAKQGKRLTNLSKAKVDDLKELCVKYNIDMDKDAVEREADKKEARQEAKVKAERKKARELEEKEVNDAKWRVVRAKEEQDKEEYNALNDNVKEKLLAMWLEYYKYEFDGAYENNKLANAKLEAEVDKMEAKYKAEGVRLVERQGKNVLQVGGIIIHHDCLLAEEFDIKEHTDCWNIDYYYKYKGFILAYEERFKVKVVVIGDDEIELF